MDVHGHGTALELKIRLSKRAGDLVSVPTEIQSTIGHRIAVGKNLGRVGEDQRNADLLELVSGVGQPMIARASAGSGVVSAVDVSAAPQSRLLRFHSVGNHPAN